MTGADAPASVHADGYRSPFVPFLILALSMGCWSAFQTVQLVLERDHLASLRASQDKQMEESKKLREVLDKLAKATLALSNRGNPNAKLIVEELGRRGITINPPLPPAAASAPAAAPADTGK